jgi:hypothetical protein
MSGSGKFGSWCIGLVLVFAASIASSSAQSSPPDTSALLQRYEPVLYFHAQEDWAPEAADSFLASARVERHEAGGKWAPLPPPLPTGTAGCTVSPCYRLNLPCPLRGGDACYELTRSDDSDWRATPPQGFTVAPRYLVRYWLFYEFDDWHTASGRLWQAHEGDWENITVALSSTLEPLFAAYSEHCSGSIRAWAGVSKRADTHPVAYAALGSHANYFTPTTTSTKFSECLRKYLDRPALARASALVKVAQARLVDRMGSAHPSGPDDVPGVARLRLVELGTALPDWARFPGRWSEGQLLWLGAKPRSLTSISEGAGPATPNWNATSVPAFWHVASS